MNLTDKTKLVLELMKIKPSLTAEKAAEEVILIQKLLVKRGFLERLLSKLHTP
jgi:hypothetical protein